MLKHLHRFDHVFQLASILFTFAVHAIRFLGSFLRSSPVLAAENLFLRKQLARKGDYAAIARCMAEDVEELQHRTSLHGEGRDGGGEVARVIEEYPSTAAELAERPEIHNLSKDIGLLWLQRLLRRGRKCRMKVFAVAQEFEVNAWKIAGEGGLRRAFTVLYLGSTAYQSLFLIKDKPYRERLRAYFDSVPYPCLVDVKGRFSPAEIPDLLGFAEVEDRTHRAEYSIANQRFVQ